MAERDVVLSFMVETSLDNEALERVLETPEFRESIQRLLQAKKLEFDQISVRDTFQSGQGKEVAVTQELEWYAASNTVLTKGPDRDKRF